MSKALTAPTVDYREVSRIHYDELSQALTAHLAKAPLRNVRPARQKISRLTVAQFCELSTDIYDEVIRRKKDHKIPYLPPRADFHPKRNEARQKLAVLPISRFEDLASDVHFELERRYPEFKEPSGRVSEETIREKVTLRLM